MLAGLGNKEQIRRMLADRPDMALEIEKALRDREAAQRRKEAAMAKIMDYDTKLYEHFSDYGQD